MHANEERETVPMKSLIAPLTPLIQRILSLQKVLLLQWSWLLKGNSAFYQQHETVLNLMKINEDLAACYQNIQETSQGSALEALYLNRIRFLEDMRFQILHELHGLDLSSYSAMPLKTV